eukprot:13700228-Alexandrium_andersonii.AAC.1
MCIRDRRAPPSSNLGQAVEARGGVAAQFGLHSGRGLSTNIGFQRVAEDIKRLRPRHVALAPPRTARSRIQNASKRTPEQ